MYLRKLQSADEPSLSPLSINHITNNARGIPSVDKSRMRPPLKLHPYSLNAPLKSLAFSLVNALVENLQIYPPVKVIPSRDIQINHLPRKGATEVGV